MGSWRRDCVLLAFTATILFQGLAGTGIESEDRDRNRVPKIDEDDRMITTPQLEVGVEEVTSAAHPDQFQTDHIHPTDPPGSPSHGGHPTYFYVSNAATILFQGWTTETWEEMMGSCIAIAVIAALYEGFKVFRLRLLKRSHGSHKVKSSAENVNAKSTTTSNGQCHSEEFTVEEDVVALNDDGRHPLLSLSHILQSFLHMVQIFVSMCLMLVFMTFNAWLCLSVTIGMGVGYYFFAWMGPLQAIRNDGGCCT